MPSQLSIPNRSASTMMNALSNMFDGGEIIFWASTIPANANTATSSANYVLARITFSTDAFATPNSSTITAATTGVLTTTAAVSSGICEWYEGVTSTNVRVIIGSVSTASADINLNTNNIAQGASVTITAYSLTIPEQ